jgi:large conductance mechanosensitive channel
MAQTKTLTPAEKKVYQAHKPDKNFFEFIRERGVIGLAVGLAIGTQLTDFVKNIVSSLINPFIVLVFGADGLTKWTWHVQIGDRSADFGIGTLLDALIRFTAVAFAVYIAVKVIGLEKLDKKPEEKAMKVPKK